MILRAARRPNPILRTTYNNKEWAEETCTWYARLSVFAASLLFNHPPPSPPIDHLLTLTSLLYCLTHLQTVPSMPILSNVGHESIDQHRSTSPFCPRGYSKITWICHCLSLRLVRFNTSDILAADMEPLTSCLLANTKRLAFCNC